MSTTSPTLRESMVEAIDKGVCQWIESPIDGTSVFDATPTADAILAMVGETMLSERAVEAACETRYGLSWHSAPASHDDARRDMRREMKAVITAVLDAAGLGEEQP